MSPLSPNHIPQQLRRCTFIFGKRHNHITKIKGHGLPHLPGEEKGRQTKQELTNIICTMTFHFMLDILCRLCNYKSLLCKSFASALVSILLLIAHSQPLNFHLLVNPPRELHPHPLQHPHLPLHSFHTSTSPTCAVLMTL